MNLRRRIETSPIVIGGLARAIALWIWFCNVTTRWTFIGTDEVDKAAREGPVVGIIWHECSLMSPVHWPDKAGKITTLSDTSPIGRVSAAVQGRFGMGSMPMSPHHSNVYASREVLLRLREGVSVGLTGDGPMGPARELKTAPLEWARAGQVSVFVYGFAMSRQRRLQTWDRMILPMPFGKGVCIYRKFSAPLPRKITPDDMATLRRELGKALTDVVEQAEEMAGVPSAGRGTTAEA